MFDDTENFIFFQDMDKHCGAITETWEKHV